MADVQLELPFDPPLRPKRMETTRMQQQRDEVFDRFAFHPATPSTGPQHDEIRKQHQQLALFIFDNVPAGRHQSLALTALQESMMWSNAAIACDSPKEH